jgi:very-short-patch-repair endonuclease
MRKSNARLLQFAREGRKHPTDTEKMLWQALRSNRLEGLKFRREALVEGYLADFYCAKHRLIIEVDGSVHLLDEVKERDLYRQAKLEKAGYRVMRFTSDEVYGAMAWVTDAIVTACSTYECADDQQK